MPRKMARSDPRPSVRVTRVLVAVSTSRLSCKRAGETRTLMPVLGFIWRISDCSAAPPPKGESFQGLTRPMSGGLKLGLRTDDRVQCQTLSGIIFFGVGRLNIGSHADV